MCFSLLVPHTEVKLLLDGVLEMSQVVLNASILGYLDPFMLVKGTSNEVLPTW